MHCKFRVILGLGFITNLKGLLKNYRPSTSFCSGRPPNDLCFDQPSLFPVLACTCLSDTCISKVVSVLLFLNTAAQVISTVGMNGTT